MLILVSNPGSSSYKYQLYRGSHVILDAHFQKIGAVYELHYTTKGVDKTRSCSAHEFDHSPQVLLKLLEEEQLITGPRDIGAIGFRVVHGGEKYTTPVKITPSVLRAIQANIEFAPLHNAIAHKHIVAWRALLPRTTFTAVFDTAFHRTIPDYITALALPHGLTNKYHIHKFGFHGTSCMSIMDQLKKHYKKTPARVIICHLGSGASITAAAKGKSMDTTMGFTPVGGIPMSTRSGDVGAGALLYLQRKLRLSPKKTEQMLNTQSGLLGLSGLSPDLRVLLEARKKKHKGATLAIASYCYHVISTIGAYITLLGGLDVLVFTAGTGEHSIPIRKEIMKGLGYHGLFLDAAKNKVHGPKISTRASKADILVLPTDEMGMIHKATHRLLKAKR